MLRAAIRLVLLATACALVYVVVTFFQVWQASQRDEARPADAIIVLGAAQYDGRPSPALRNRLDHAADLYHDDVAPIVVVTGGQQPGDRFTEAEAGARYLQAHGVPDGDIRREVQGENSWESLAAAARFLRDEQITSVVLVSDPYHAMRIDGIAHELGLDAVVSPASGGSSFGALVRETAAVSIGRIIGYDRLVRIDDRVDRP